MRRRGDERERLAKDGLRSPPFFFVRILCGNCDDGPCRPFFQTVLVSRQGCCGVENRWLLRVRFLAERYWDVRMYSAGKELRYDRCLGQRRLQKMWKDLVMQSELATVIAQSGCCRC